MDVGQGDMASLLLLLILCTMSENKCILGSSKESCHRYMFCFSVNLVALSGKVDEVELLSVNNISCMIHYMAVAYIFQFTHLTEMILASKGSMIHLLWKSLCK